MRFRPHKGNSICPYERFDLENYKGNHVGNKHADSRDSCASLFQKSGTPTNRLKLWRPHFQGLQI